MYDVVTALFPLCAKSYVHMREENSPKEKFSPDEVMRKDVRRLLSLAKGGDMARLHGQIGQLFHVAADGDHEVVHIATGIVRCLVNRLLNALN